MPIFAKQHRGGFEIDWVDLPSLDLLKGVWRDLEARSDISFFTTWSWIGTWLSTLPSTVTPRLLRATLNGRVMGMGLLGSSIKRKTKLIPLRTCLLNETGIPDLDRLTIEYNGLLIDETVQHLLEPMMIQFMLDKVGSWDQIQFNALTRPVTTPRTLNDALPRQAQATVTRTRRLAYQVGLSDVRSAGQHVKLIKPKPRYHIRRSLKAYEALGPVTLTEAKSVNEALQYLNSLKTKHQTYWQAKGQEGAFNSAFFCQFHEQLIRSCFDRGEIQLLAIKAGKHDVGYLYNFVWNGHVYNYQSGINYQELGGKHSPGMVAHTLAIEFNAQLGHHTYDLMVGDHQYKRALCLQTVNLNDCVIRRNNFQTKAEDLLVHVASRAIRSKTLASLSANNWPDWVASPAVLSAIW